ncbi:Coenzyme F420 hydrogenase/dehydrogenase, beta subunit C-terminal domain [Enterovibrio coralii]|uniref:Coenzyme F420 hydrogenase/dehydrogenase beta subunit C-terminal domain-containing protein n=1 Tax=Enterovibrio coralii TaxID=294935 RepID=A0A135I505_9GAMM|nr:Coenzyme F420 hydrogenase/dehydrogenase, beta subunit C-terminal domain [Enterovibrio coralii]KXF80531.1 hypothetical protein ATN88_07545 [Enterovibrio coralii]
MLTEQGCCLCGLCVGMCGQISAYQDQIAVTGGCKRQGGFCQTLCPKITPDAGREHATILTYRYDSGQRQLKSLLQTIARHLLSSPDDKLVAAISTEDALTPMSTTLDNDSDIEGLRFTHPCRSPTLASVFSLLKSNSTIHLIGTPCEALALKGERRKYGPISAKLGLTVSVACDVILDRNQLLRWMREMGVSRPIKNARYQGGEWSFKDAKDKHICLDYQQAKNMAFPSCVACEFDSQYCEDIKIRRITPYEYEVSGRTDAGASFLSRNHHSLGLSV